MKISYQWLKKYLNFDLSPETLSELLTDSGLEVEGLEKWQSVKGGLEGIVIGEVKTCAKHPNADKLSVTTVDVGSGIIVPIVCGAPNVAAGQKVVVAKVGAKIYSEDESFEIKKAKLRGEISEGMICAEDELGLGESHDGIMVLNTDKLPGTPAAEYFNVEEDYLIEIGLTPNRTDGMSHIGVVRDIKAVLDNKDFLEGKKSFREINYPDVSGFEIDDHSLNIEIEVLNPEACIRYAGLTISGIQVSESPEWLKNKLKVIGLRPINNIVDITNYVLHETGQPLHAFDADEVKGNKVEVKKMDKGTKFITLDEIERELTDQDLMICNIDNGMCIGGIFGGVKSGVTEKTKNIFLESACFDPIHIRKSAKYHDLQTDASFRFERGVDPNFTIYALKRAALLIKELAGGKISSEIKDIYPDPLKKTKIEVSWKNINRLIGKELSKDIIKNILDSLEFEVTEENDNGLDLLVPTYRFDVTREADVIEEILRIYGYNYIEIPSKQISAIAPSKHPNAEKIRNSLAEFLSANGFNEMMNNSLTRSEYYEKGEDFDAQKSVQMLNPLSRDLNVMRQCLLFGGLEVIVYNLNRKVNDIKLFELGKVYSKILDIEPSEEVTKRYNEENQIALFASGRMEKESWYTDDKQVDHNYLKSILVNILAKTGLDLSRLEFEASSLSYYAEGMIYSLNGKQLLEIGSISKTLLKQFDIKQPVYFASVNMDLLIKTLKKKATLYKEVSKFPEVRRDLALLVNEEVEFAEIERIAFGIEKKLLKEINLFDVYAGKNIEKGKKSYAVSFILQDKEKTLTDKVIDKIMKKMMMAFQQNLDAVIR
jgi:phenylalanyl-tRNA synthetase beta chain